MNRLVNYIIYTFLLSLPLSTQAMVPRPVALSDGICKNNPGDTIAPGKKIFLNRCANCHTIFKDRAGPALAGVSERWPDKKELFAFIRNPAEVIARNAYAGKLKEKFGSVQPAFLLTDKEIQSILDYIKEEEKVPPARSE